MKSVERRGCLGGDCAFYFAYQFFRPVNYNLAMTVFVFGAGSTLGALSCTSQCPPVTKAFGKCLPKEKFPHLNAVACHLKQDLTTLGLEDLWSCIDYRAKFSEKRRHGMLADPEWLDGAVWELKRAILSIYGQQCDRAARTISRRSGTLPSLLKKVQSGDTIISFNYDTVIERLARVMKLRLRHSASRLRTAVQFAKPHGSVSWCVSELLPCVPGPPLIDSLPLDSVLCGNSTTEPLVLGAVPIKSELIWEVQKCYNASQVFELVMQQWRVLIEGLRDADVVVVVGYSFPKEDHHGRFLFMEGIRQRQKRLKRVEYYNLNRDSEPAIKEIFGCTVVWKGPVKSWSKKDPASL